jgi:hypothetical protein
MVCEVQRVARRVYDNCEMMIVCKKKKSFE